MTKFLVCLAAAVCLCGCAQSAEQRLRAALATQETGLIELPAGRLEIASPLVVGEGSHDLQIVGLPDSVIAAADDFEGRALLVIENARAIKLTGFAMDGNREVLEKPFEMAPPENAFRVWYPFNGVLADQVEGLEIADARFANVVHFPVLVSRSSAVRIHDVTVEDSGARNALGRNNLSGGILIEEGSRDFEVRGSVFRRIPGNALWTHSLYSSERLADGVFAGNEFDTIGRDALQVGHATRVRVENNHGVRIGYPLEVVDIENDGTPVGIDTAGDVDETVYVGNRFEEINGKCIDLDGFHDGAVRDNICVNRGAGEDYPHGHFGIVMNNTNPDAHSDGIELTGNTIDGAKYGGLFVMGSGNRVAGNRFVNLNLAGCDGEAPMEQRAAVCVYRADEPDMLASGIYLGRGVARLEETAGNVIEGNEVTGPGMGSHCIGAGVGVDLRANTILGNRCSDAAGR